MRQNQLKAILIAFDNKLKIDILTGCTNYQHQWKDRYTFKCSGPYKSHWKETDLKNTSQFCYKHTCTCRNCNLMHFCKQGQWKVDHKIVLSTVYFKLSVGTKLLINNNIGLVSWLVLVLVVTAPLWSCIRRFKGVGWPPKTHATR